MSAMMIEMNRAAAAGLAALLNTLWYAGAVVVLTWAGLRCARRVNAATRYWVWTGVLAFLIVVPFLPHLAAQARAALADRKTAAAVVTPLTSVPASLPSIRQLAPVTLTLNTAPGSKPWPLWLLGAWIVAAAWQLERLARGLTSVRRLKGRAEVSSHDTVFVSWACAVDTEKPTAQRPCRGYPLPVNIRRQVRLLTSAEIDSPVAVGYRHPAVIVPPRLLERLEDGERQNVLLHELAHLARYDDWLTLATRALGALLILHPLAALVLGRIEREREMACDDFVVARTGSARSYARSLARLHDLRWSAGTRLLAAGLFGGGSSLGDRIESLLRRGRKFSAQPSLASLGVSTLLLAVLLGAGSLMPSWIAIAQTKVNTPHSGLSPVSGTAAPALKFEVASIRVDKSVNGISRLINPPNDGRYYATGPTLKELINFAYGVDDWQILGGPKWISTERFDIAAEAGGPVNKELKSLSRDQGFRIKSQMLQTLLADRFTLKLHREMRKLPVYILVLTKHGQKLQPGRVEGSMPSGYRGPRPPALLRSYQLAGGEQELSFENEPISYLTGFLQRELGGRRVLDRTGLSGRYNFILKWTPNASPKPTFNSEGVGGSEQSSMGTPQILDTSGPSIFTAVNQLGLRLKPGKGPVEVLVIDHVEPPTPN